MVFFHSLGVTNFILQFAMMIILKERDYMLNKKFIISGCLPIVVATIITYFGYFINTYHLDTSIQIASNGMNSMYMSQGRYVVVLLNKILYGNYSLYDNQIVPFITIFILILCGSYLYFWC